MSNRNHPDEFTPEEQMIQDDHDWAMSDPTVLHLFVGKVVAVQNKVVLGFGANHMEAKKHGEKSPQYSPNRRMTILPIYIIQK